MARMIDFTRSCRTTQGVLIREQAELQTLHRVLILNHMRIPENAWNEMVGFVESAQVPGEFDIHFPHNQGPHVHGTVDDAEFLFSDANAAFDFKIRFG